MIWSLIETTCPKAFIKFRKYLAHEYDLWIRQDDIICSLEREYFESEMISGPLYRFFMEECRVLRVEITTSYLKCSDSLNYYYQIREFRKPNLVFLLSNPEKSLTDIENKAFIKAFELFESILNNN